MEFLTGVEPTRRVGSKARFETEGWSTRMAYPGRDHRSGRSICMVQCLHGSPTTTAYAVIHSRGRQQRHLG